MLHVCVCAFVCGFAFASLPVVIRMCIVVCVYFVRKPTSLVHTPKRVKESPVKSDSNGDCRWSKVVAAFWDALATIWFRSQLQVATKEDNASQLTKKQRRNKQPLGIGKLGADLSQRVLCAE